MSIETALAELKAIDRLVTIAKGDTGQSRRVANFLLAWWNAGDNGGFDFTDLWNVDQAIVDDMVTVFGLIARMRIYPDTFGFEADFRQLVTDWRGGRAKAVRS
jgi:hypothetical protein